MYFRDAGGVGGVIGRSYAFGGQVQLDVIDKAVKLETIAYELTYKSLWL